MEHKTEEQQQTKKLSSGRGLTLEELLALDEDEEKHGPLAEEEEEEDLGVDDSNTEEEEENEDGGEEEEDDVITFEDRHNFPDDGWYYGNRTFSFPLDLTVNEPRIDPENPTLPTRFDFTFKLRVRMLRDEANPVDFRDTDVFQIFRSIEFFVDAQKYFDVSIAENTDPELDSGSWDYRHDRDRMERTIELNIPFDQPIPLLFRPQYKSGSAPGRRRVVKGWKGPDVQVRFTTAEKETSKFHKLLLERTMVSLESPTIYLGGEALLGGELDEPQILPAEEE